MLHIGTGPGSRYDRSAYKPLLSLGEEHDRKPLLCSMWQKSPILPIVNPSLSQGHTHGQLEIRSNYWSAYTPCGYDHDMRQRQSAQGFSQEALFSSFSSPPVAQQVMGTGLEDPLGASMFQKYEASSHFGPEAQGGRENTSLRHSAHAYS